MHIICLAYSWQHSRLQRSVCYHLAPFFFFPPRAGLPGWGFCCRGPAAELALDEVAAELTDDGAAADVPGFGELTELLGGDDVDGLLASLVQSHANIR